MKKTLNETRNKSPPQLIRTSDCNIKATSNDANGNSFIIKVDEEKKMSQIKNSRHLDDIINKKIEKTVIQDAKSQSLKKGKGYRYYGKLTIEGKNQNGKAKINQDTPLVYLNVGDISGFNLFGVLDGHGQNGQIVSLFCKDYFIKVMNRYAELCIKSKLTTAEAIYKELKRTQFAYIIDAYNKADVYLSQQQKTFDCNFNGTTCIIVFQFNNHLVCASVGDSRGIVVFDEGNKQNKGIFALSTDHKPDLPEESDRIKSHGGVIEQFKDDEGNKVGPLRIWKAGKNYPGLAMTRTLGDFKAKEAGVIPTPQIKEYTINHNSKFMVICSDGVWEFMKNEQVRDIGNSFFMKNDIGGFCTNLVKSAMQNWEQFDIIRDDITVVCVFF
jgi:serine/threonine protein phosphatase PrpC